MRQSKRRAIKINVALRLLKLQIIVDFPQCVEARRSSQSKLIYDSYVSSYGRSGGSVKGFPGWFHVSIYGHVCHQIPPPRYHITAEIPSGPFNVKSHPRINVAFLQFQSRYCKTITFSSVDQRYYFTKFCETGLRSNYLITLFQVPELLD